MLSYQLDVAIIESLIFFLSVVLRLNMNYQSLQCIVSMTCTTDLLMHDAVPSAQITSPFDKLPGGRQT